MNEQVFLFEDVEPYPQAVGAAELLNEIEMVIKKHVVLSGHAAAALAAWVLHTYSFELRDAVAYVAIESPEKRCGKTTLVSVLAALAHKPLVASNITASALFQAIDSCRPTLFIDEAHTFLAGNGTLRGIMNAGNTWRTAYVLRLTKTRKARGQCQESGREGLEGMGGAEVGAVKEDETARVGERLSLTPALSRWERWERGMHLPPAHGPSARPILDAEASHRRPATGGNEAGLKRFSCWCPKVMALIGDAPDTIADRSIVVRMSRKLTSEARAPLTELESNMGQIRAKCARFVMDAREAIRGAERIRAEGLNDRAADTFEPLFVIARLAGADWEKKLQEAAGGLAAAQKQDVAAALLREILMIFVETRSDRMFSRDLTDLLRDGWYGMRSLSLKRSEMDEYEVARALRPYGIRPATIRQGKEVNKGYRRDDFQQALKRYLPSSELEALMAEMAERAKLRLEAKAEEEQENDLTEANEGNKEKKEGGQV